MTEEEWDSAIPPDVGCYLGPVIQFLRARTSDRQLRLFGVAWCHIWIKHVRIPRSLSVGGDIIGNPFHPDGRWVLADHRRCQPRESDLR